MRHYLYQCFWNSVDWLYPPVCGGCEKTGHRWCEDCKRNAKIILPPYCELCGQPTQTPGKCSKCAQNLPTIANIRSWAIFGGPVRNALHQLKYRKNIGLGEALSQHMVDLLQQMNWDIQIVIPVPLSVERLKQRGYNQAAHLAMPIAFSLKIPYKPKALMRVRETQSQVDLGLDERRKNVFGAFEAIPAQVSGKNVLIVDDVATSGSTLNACADALLLAGSKKVYGLTLARAE